MKHADIVILANGSGRLGPYGADPVRYGGFPGGWLKTLRTIIDWLDRRRQRQALTLLDDRLLEDIGVRAADVDHEVRKPFWRP